LENLYKKPERVVYTGTPVRAGFKHPSDGDESTGGGLKPLVVSFWGSLGADRMNESIAEFIKLNIEAGQFDHIHATGRKHTAEELKARCITPGSDDLPQGIEVREYIEDMPSVMAAADVVLCRAGASTIAELTLLGKPAVLVPSPYVTNNHQEENALQLEKAGGAITLNEKDCTGKLLFETVSSLLQDKGKLKKMSEAQKSFGAPGATEKIVDLIMEITTAPR